MGFSWLRVNNSLGFFYSSLFIVKWIGWAIFIVLWNRENELWWLTDLSWRLSNLTRPQSKAWPHPRKITKLLSRSSRWSGLVFAFLNRILLSCTLPLRSIKSHSIAGRTSVEENWTPLPKLLWVHSWNKRDAGKYGIKIFLLALFSRKKRG